MLIWGCHSLGTGPAPRDCPQGSPQALAPDGNSIVLTNRPAWRGCQPSPGNATTIANRGIPTFLPSSPQLSTGVSFCRTRVWGNALRGAEKGHACGSENGADMLDGPILAGLGGLPAGAAEENEDRDGRHSSSNRGPLPSKRHHPGRSHGTCQGAGRQPSLLPRYGWGYSPLTSGDVVENPGWVASMMPSVIL